MADAHDIPDGASAPAGAPIDPVAGKSVAEVFGEIVWLMTQDPACRDMRLADLEAEVMPPILLKQFHITYAPVPSGRTVAGEPVRAAGEAAGATDAPGASKPALQPVRAEFHAFMSDAVAARLDAHPEGDLALVMADWHSGPLRRVIRTIAPFGIVAGGGKRPAR